MPLPSRAGKYTGNVRFRKDWFGRLMIQMERTIYKADPTLEGPTTEWDWASERDLYYIRAVRKQKGMEPLL